MPHRPLPTVGAALAAALLCLPAANARAQIVKVTTPLGDYYMQMLPDDAPGYVANFMGYVERGDYDNAIIHRLAPGFVIQGGGFYPFSFEQLTSNPPTFETVFKGERVLNEPGISNTRGTVSMAKTAPPEEGGPPDGGPDSATNQWFVNLGDNSANLDFQNGGFTVFANVVQGMDVVDAIGSLVRWNFDDLTPFPTAFGSVPMLDSFPGAVPWTLDHFVTTHMMEILPGDTDGDGDVDDADLGTILVNFTGPVGAAGGKFFEDGDTDFDGDVDDADLANTISAFTGPQQSPAGVPEPASLTLLAAGGLALARRRR